MMIFGSLMRFCVDGILMELVEHNASVLRRYSIDAGLDPIQNFLGLPMTNKFLQLQGASLYLGSWGHFD